MHRYVYGNIQQDLHHGGKGLRKQTLISILEASLSKNSCISILHSIAVFVLNLFVLPFSLILLKTCLRLRWRYSTTLIHDWQIALFGGLRFKDSEDAGFQPGRSFERVQVFSQGCVTIQFEFYCR